jgi:hypothetical protein
LVRFCAAVAIFVATTIFAAPDGSLVSASAATSLEERKLPMHFTWYDQIWHDQGTKSHCVSTCNGLIAAVGVITSDTPREFAEFANGRDLKGSTIVLDSSGGSVLDAIKLGQQWRDLDVMTSVGIVTTTQTSARVSSEVFPGGYCESMCVFLLLSGKTRYVPEGAHVRVHQIWMGDRAEDAKAANYVAQDVMIIERDVGRLAKYAFEMGATGDLLALALSVPPWEPLHELTAAELRQTNLVTDDMVAHAGPDATNTVADVQADVQSGKKPIQDRFAVSAQSSHETPKVVQADPLKPEHAAEATAPTGTASLQH